MDLLANSIPRRGKSMISRLSEFPRTTSRQTASDIVQSSKAGVSSYSVCITTNTPDSIPDSLSQPGAAYSP